jgi:hypothetical protein
MYSITILDLLTNSDVHHILWCEYILTTTYCALISNNFVFLCGCGIVCATIYLALAGV